MKNGFLHQQKTPSRLKSKHTHSGSIKILKKKESFPVVTVASFVSPGPASSLTMAGWLVGCLCKCPQHDIHFGCILQRVQRVVGLMGERK
ncbi:hypothetical protein CEXT_810581 [Caerostris extrusa]|uniref:Uncharacterized protein n=1 Tax=Caerostris extrusa TaxID=172846 RepID=A0AAV4QMY3_CAEEX|nr:hypothetical protein CEXT_810581 [Caerostris extrusa]